MEKCTIKIYQCGTGNKSFEAEFLTDKDVACVMVACLIDSKCRQNDCFNIQLCQDTKIVHTQKRIIYQEVGRIAQKMVTGYFEALAIKTDNMCCFTCGAAMESRVMEPQDQCLMIPSLNLCIGIPGLMELICPACGFMHKVAGPITSMQLIPVLQEEQTKPSDIPGALSSPPNDRQLNLGCRG